MTTKQPLMTNLTEAIAKRKWKKYSNKDASYKIEESLFNEMMVRLHDIPEHVRLAILPDAAFAQLYKLLAKSLRDEIRPLLQAAHAQGFEVAMQESHISKPFRMTIHYLSDGETVYITRSEMLPYT